jgi:hypothetical protein
MAIKKELEAYHKNGSALYSLRFVKGGQLPDMLDSEYTSTKEAYKQRDLYYAGKLTKKDKQVA